MKDKVVNPFLSYHPPHHEGGDCVIVAPKPASGLQLLQLSPESHPNLYEVFVDLAQSRFDYLDLDSDIDDAERELLYERGVLVDADNAPERPFFCCLLDDIEPTGFDGDVSALIVNPSFQFSPFDFADLASKLLYGHLSGRPSAWIAEEVTGIERGYWFDLEQAGIVSQFKAGEKLPFEIEPEMQARLITAGILTTPEAIAERTRSVQAKIDAAREKYITDKYVTIPELLPPEQMAAMRKYFRQYVGHGFMPFEDGQSVRYYQHNEPLATVFHKQLTRLMSLVVGEEVIPSYVYAASYVEHADLTPHTDRPQCEFSISFQVDYLPEPPGYKSPWGLFVWQPEWSDEPIGYDSKEFPAASEAEDTNSAVYLASGDGLIYKGRELIHYRYPLAAGHQSTSLFFHYVPKDFEGELG